MFHFVDGLPLYDDVHKCSTFEAVQGRRISDKMSSYDSFERLSFLLVFRLPQQFTYSIKQCIYMAPLKQFSKASVTSRHI